MTSEQEGGALLPPHAADATATSKPTSAPAKTLFVPYLDLEIMAASFVLRRSRCIGRALRPPGARWGEAVQRLRLVMQSARSDRREDGKDGRAVRSNRVRVDVYQGGLHASLQGVDHVAPWDAVTSARVQGARVPRARAVPSP